MIANAANICAAACGSWRQSRPAKVTWETCWPAPKQSYTAQPGKPCCRRSLCMPHRKSARRWGQGCPAGLSIAKSADAENAGATQHSPKHRPQSARRTRCPPPRAEAEGSGSSLNTQSPGRTGPPLRCQVKATCSTWRTRARAPAPEFRCAVLRARAGRWLSARLHADVIHKRGLRPLLRAVDAPDPAQFFGDLRPVPARIVAAPWADDLVGALGCVVPHALT